MESNYQPEKSRDFRRRWTAVNRREQALAPRAGFEPATNRLTAGCSTAELPGNSSCRARNAYNKAGRALKAAKRRESPCVRLGFARAGLPGRSSRRLAGPPSLEASAGRGPPRPERGGGGAGGGDNRERG